MTFTQKQREQIWKQLKAHERFDIECDIDLGKDNKLHLDIERGVFGTDIMGGSLYSARFLYANPQLYRNKKTMDLGCGPGAHGIIMAENGADEVIFSDINPRSVRNTMKNLRNHRLFPYDGTFKTKISVYESDLFEVIPKPSDSKSNEKPYDIIVFNHPFFAGDIENESTNREVNKYSKDLPKDYTVQILRCMLGGTELIKKFLTNVHDYIDKDSRIIMPYWTFAGPDNDPENRAPEYDFRIDKKHRMKSEEGLQQGQISIYEIMLK